MKASGEQDGVTEIVSVRLTWREVFRAVFGGPVVRLLMDAERVIAQRESELRSLRASLDDARAEISRLTAEKHARDVALRRVIEAAESVHAQGERAGE